MKEILKRGEEVEHDIERKKRQEISTKKKEEKRRIKIYERR